MRGTDSEPLLVAWLSKGTKEKKGRESSKAVQNQYFVRMQKQSTLTFNPAAVRQQGTRLGIVKGIECRCKRGMESLPHHGNIAKVIVNQEIWRYEGMGNKRKAVDNKAHL